MAGPESAKLPSKPVLFMRSALYFLVMTLSTVLLTFPVVFASFLSQAWCAALVRFWVMLNLRSLASICKIGYRLEGENNIPQQPCIIYAKHQSTWETLFIKWRFPDAIFVAKRELVLIPFFGWALASLNFILIDRRSGRRAIRQMIDQYRERKQQGYWVVIFPEGTRKAVGAKPDYKLGGSVLAVETDTDLLPLAINAGEFWPRHSFIKWPGEVTVSIGPSLSPAGKTPEFLRDEARTWLEGKMAEISVPDRFA